MAALVCEICGGKLMGKPGGIFECDSCGMEYSTEWARAKIQEIKGTVKVEGTVEVQGTVKVEGPVKVEGAANAKSLLKRGQMALEDRKFDEAKSYFNQVLDIDPECGMAYFGLALVAKRGSLETLAEVCLEHEPKEIQRARQFADDETRKELEKLDAEKEARTLFLAECRETLPPIRKRLEKAQKLLQMGKSHTVGLKADGTVIATGSNGYGQCNVCNWTDIIAVSAASDHTVGLKADGTVVAVGENYYSQCEVSSWTDIVAISTNNCHTVGLRADGTVVATQYKYTGDRKCYGERDVNDWIDIVDVSAGAYHTVGLKSDGTVVATGSNGRDRCNVSDWTNIVTVSTGGAHTVGLKADGTVVAVGWNENSQCDVSDWTDIVAVSAGNRHTVGLRADGTVVATQYKGDQKSYGQCDVSDWADIVAISAGGLHTIGLKSDGTVVAVGYGIGEVSGWKLFNSIDTLEQERNEAREAARQRQQENLRRQQRTETAPISEEDMLLLIQEAEAENKRKNQARIAQLKSEKRSIEYELPTLKGLFSGGRRRELEAKLAEIEHELKTLQ